MLLKKGNVQYDTDCLSEETVKLLLEDGYKEVKENKRGPKKITE